jgi:hypothetical protein
MFPFGSNPLAVYQGGFITVSDDCKHGGQCLAIMQRKYLVA